jgi:hypothetical protein
MQKMVVCGALALAACGGGQKTEPAGPGTAQGSAIGNRAPADTAPPKPTSDLEIAMAEMKGFRDKICACVDAACVQKVADDMTAWGQEMQKKLGDKPKFTEDQQTQLQQIGQQMGECMTKAMQNGSPPPNPGNNPCGGGP